MKHTEIENEIFRTETVQRIIDTIEETLLEPLAPETRLSVLLNGTKKPVS